MDSSSSFVDGPAVRLQSAPPAAAICYDDGAMRFDVDGVEAFRLTTHGMHYRGQLVEDGGLAHGVVLDWTFVFLQLRDALARREAFDVDTTGDSDNQSTVDFDDPLN